MPRSRANTILAILIPVFMMLGGNAGRAHDGHDHGAPPPVSATIAPRAEASTPQFELVLVARGSELILHLDEFGTNAPIRAAELVVDAPSGSLKPVARGDGTYTVSDPSLARPGTHDLAITVSAMGMVDILAASLTIPEPPAGREIAAPMSSWFAAPAYAEELRQRVTANGLSLWLTLGVGFAAGILAALLFARRRGPTTAALALLVGLIAFADRPAYAESAAAPGPRDVMQRFADGALFVPKSTQHLLALRTQMTEDQVHRRTIELPGRIIPSPNASGLVQASSGGRLSPPPGGFKSLGAAVKAGDLLAFVHLPLSLADATTQQQQARELDQEISLISRKIERLEAIQQVIAKSQLEDAELELKGLLKRRASLEGAQRTAEALVAPVDGVIAAANAVSGQMAEPNAVIFTIVDPTVLWIEALSYEAHAIDGKARAQLPDGRTADLAHLGTGFSDRNQAVPVHFAIRGDTGGLRAGQFVTVLASTASERHGIALPREAVLRAGNGQNIVYEHTNAERFVARDVRVEPLDGSRILVVAGIEPGRRIVVQGAELLNQVR